MPTQRRLSRLLAAEGLKAGAAGGVGYLAGGDYQSALIGASLRGGYKFGQMAVAKRYAKALADLAMSEDPETIQRILSKVSRDPEYMKFSRAVADGLNGAAPNAAAAAAKTQVPVRREPRFFAGGGRVSLVKGALEFLGSIGDDAAKSTPDKVLKKLSGNSKFDDPPFPVESRRQYLGFAPGRSNVTITQYTPKVRKQPKHVYGADSQAGRQACCRDWQNTLAGHAGLHP